MSAETISPSSIELPEVASHLVVVPSQAEAPVDQVQVAVAETVETVRRRSERPVGPPAEVAPESLMYDPQSNAAPHSYAAYGKLAAKKTGQAARQYELAPEAEQPTYKGGSQPRNYRRATREAEQTAPSVEASVTTGEPIVATEAQPAQPEPAAAIPQQRSGKKLNQKDRFDEIAHLVDTNKRGRAIRPDKSIMSREEIAVITAHKDQIEAGLPGIVAEDKPQTDSEELITNQVDTASAAPVDVPVPNEDAPDQTDSSLDALLDSGDDADDEPTDEPRRRTAAGEILARAVSGVYLTEATAWIGDKLRGSAESGKATAWLGRAAVSAMVLGTAYTLHKTGAAESIGEMADGLSTASMMDAGSDLIEDAKQLYAESTANDGGVASAATEFDVSAAEAPAEAPAEEAAQAAELTTVEAPAEAAAEIAPESTATPVAEAPVPTAEISADTPTIWDIAEDRLHINGQHPTDQQIVEEMHRLQELNHIHDEEAKKLIAGTKIKV